MLQKVHGYAAHHIIAVMERQDFLFSAQIQKSIFIKTCQLKYGGNLKMLIRSALFTITTSKADTDLICKYICTMAKASKKKTKKENKRAKGYDDKLAVNGSFLQILQASAKHANANSAKKPT